MSAVLQIFDQQRDAIAIAHDDDLLLKPGDFPARGYADVAVVDPELTSKRSQHIPIHLRTGEFVPTHIVRIRRDQITDVDLEAVNIIEFGDGKTYRAKYVVDDPMTGPDVEFYCTLA